MKRRTLLAATGAAAVVSMLPGGSAAATPNQTRRLAIYRRAAALLARHPQLRVGQAVFWAAYADGLVRSRCEALFAHSPYFDDARLVAFDRWLEQRLPDEPAL